jgi:signal transduction histidine kinase
MYALWRQVLSNHHKDLAISAEEQIELLTKALAREKVARQQLEQKIAETNDKQFGATKELLESYETARIRQIQLEFLSFLNRENIEDKTIGDLTKFFVENVLELIGQYTAIIYQSKEGQIGNVQTLLKESNQWQKVTMSLEAQAILTELIPVEDSTWIRTTITEKINAVLPNLTDSLLLSLKVPQHQSLDKVILINIEHYCYSNDFKHTLEIAANHFTGIIQKRSTETMLSTNYSQLKKALRLLKKTQKQLTHNEKMVSLGQLAAGIAHEINNPLSYLSSNLETLQDYIKQYESVITKLSANTPQSDTDLSELKFLKEDSEELLQACLNGVSRVSDIVINLKQFSKKGTDDFTSTDLIEVLEASLAIVSNQIKYKYEVTMTHQSETSLVNGNFGQLQQVFVNLFMNAIDAMPESGTLTIKSHYKNDEVIVTVQDNGIGMKSETATRIFEPFYTTKGDTKGTGLGLSVSYAIITKHNATITVDSTTNEGTTFKLVFPAFT